MAVKTKGKFYWIATMDLQMINNADGAAYYVCHYLCKPELDELRCALSNHINTVFRQNTSMTAFQRLWNILCVDFFQIKPVWGTFAFQNRFSWDLFQPVFLRENDRRSNDLNYLALLNRARVGMLSDHDIGTLKSRLSCLFVQNHAQCSLHEQLLMNTTCDVCITYLHISIQLQLSTCSTLMIPILMHLVRESLYQQMIETQEACLLFYKFPLVPGYAYS